MSETFASKIIAFNRELDYTGTLPDGFEEVNPCRENPATCRVMEQFYRTY